jgi:hypothetical protein
MKGCSGSPAAPVNSRNASSRDGARAARSATRESASSRPWPITTTCSAISAISLIRWLDTNTTRPCAASDLSRSRIQWIPAGSRPLTGSSSNSTGGSPSSAAAMPSRCAMPSEYLPARLPAALARPTIPSTSSTRRVAMPLLAASAARCARAVRPGWNALASSSAPTCRSGQRRSRYRCPLIRTRPASGRSRPRISRIVVDFPDPFGPRKPVTVPGRTSKLSASTAGTPP